MRFTTREIFRINTHSFTPTSSAPSLHHIPGNCKSIHSNPTKVQQTHTTNCHFPSYFPEGNHTHPPPPSALFLSLFLLPNALTLSPTPYPSANNPPTSSNPSPAVSG